MRKEFEMTADDLADLLKAMKPTPVMFLSGGQPMGPSQQENANAAWARLGEKYGFDYMTVQPHHSTDARKFTAVVKGA